MGDKTILVIEDDELNFKLVKTLLQFSQCNVLEAMGAERRFKEHLLYNFDSRDTVFEINADEESIYKDVNDNKKHSLLQTENRYDEKFQNRMEKCTRQCAYHV